MQEGHRKGSFFPAILQPWRRIDQALYAVVMEAYVNACPPGRVDDLVAALRVESGISKSEVSRICIGLDEQVEAFRVVVVAPGSPLLGAGRCWAATSAIRRTRCSGAASCAP